MTWGNFFCAVVAAVTINVFLTAIDTSVTFGLLNTPGMFTFGTFNVSIASSFNVCEMPYFAVMGVGGGLLGALFNYLNEKITIWRLKYINKYSHRRFLEVGWSVG